MFMGVYSYLTEMTEEKDRTFRFGIFAVFVPLIPIASIPFAGILFQKLRYISKFIRISMTRPSDWFGLINLSTKHFAPHRIDFNLYSNQHNWHFVHHIHSERGKTLSASRRSSTKRC